MKIQFTNALAPNCMHATLIVFRDTPLSASVQQIDQALQGALTGFIRLRDFQAKEGAALTLAPLVHTHLQQLTVVGAGHPSDLNEQACWNLGGHVVTALRKDRVTDVTIVLDGRTAVEVAAVAAGMQLRDWRFDQYKTMNKAEATPRIETVTVVCDDPEAARQAFEDAQKIVEGVHLTRTLVSEPANVLYPATFAQQAQELTQLGVDVQVLSQAQLEEMGMGALIGVGVGSDKDTLMVVMQWRGAADQSAQPIAFVGKGVTFDSGGISIKPAKGMEEMKTDMAGAAVVVGLMKTLALRHASVNVVGTIALVENMPSGTAQRPGDIVRSYSGQTIEVLNTDAEGRLILADALWYTQEQFNPKFMIDLATLTGAIVVALGHEYAGLFSNHAPLIDQLKAAGEATGEKVWPMPLDPAFDKEIDSPIADMQNITNGYGAGSITAAQFLQRFVNKTPWAHLDIAGVARSDKNRTLSEKGATAFGVRLLDRLVRDFYEARG